MGTRHYIRPHTLYIIVTPYGDAMKQYPEKTLTAARKQVVELQGMNWHKLKKMGFTIERYSRVTEKKEEHEANRKSVQRNENRSS